MVYYVLVALSGDGKSPTFERSLSHPSRRESGGGDTGES